MPLSELEIRRIEKIFNEYCHKKIPSHLHSQIRIEYRVRGYEVTLFESRPVWDDRTRWISGKVARFKKNPESETWSLYWADRNGRWCHYQKLAFHRDLEKLLGEVEKNENGAFWG